MTKGETASTAGGTISNEPGTNEPATAGRRALVLESALQTFARFGYRKTSMEEVARSARISRPGLYFLFDSKEDLFRSAVSHALEHDLTSVRDCLDDAGRPLTERLLAAFTIWAGRYVGPITRDIAGVIEDNPDLLGSVVETAPSRFADLVTRTITADPSFARRRTTAEQTARTLISTSIGIKHQVDSADDYTERMAVAIGLLLP